MADKLKVFIAIAAVLAGAILIVNLNPFRGFVWWYWNEDYSAPVISWNHINQAGLGIILLAAGLTHFWTTSRFYRS